MTGQEFVSILWRVTGFVFALYVASRVFRALDTLDMLRERMEREKS